MIYLILITSLCLSILEGYREFIVYEIDRAGRFPKRDLAVRRKGINAGIYIGFMTMLIVFHTVDSLDVSFLILCTLFVRWLVLDGVLNLFRDLPFFYIGSVSTIDKIARHFPWVVPFVKIGGLLVTLCFVLC